MMTKNVVWSKKLIRNANSFVVGIPIRIVEEEHLCEGQEIRLVNTGKGCIKLTWKPETAKENNI